MDKKMDTIPHDDRYYVHNKPCNTMKEAMLYAGVLQRNGEVQSIPIYQNGKAVRIKRF